MRFVLDQNFPIQATGLPWPQGLDVCPLTAIDPALTRNHDDWEVLRALHRRGDVDGFITNDEDILHLPREMVMLSRKQLTPVVTDGLGHDPLGATGLLMLHLPQIAKQNHPPPRIYRLRRPTLQVTWVGMVITGLARRARTSTPELVRQELAEINRMR